jgi:hypothetical protein
VTEQSGLVGQVVYRPSRTTQILRKYELLTAAERDWFERILKRAETVREESFEGLPLQRRALVLDTAYDYLRYLEVSDDDHKERYKKMERVLLEGRSGLKISSDPVPIPPVTSPPETGHRTARAGLGWGWRDDEPFEELAVRPAYHDFVDDETGYTPDSQIEVLSARLRYYNHRRRAKIEDLTLISIASIFPMDPLFEKWSWKVGAGLHTANRETCGYCDY